MLKRKSEQNHHNHTGIVPISMIIGPRRNKKTSVNTVDQYICRFSISGFHYNTCNPEGAILKLQQMTF